MFEKFSALITNVKEIMSTTDFKEKQALFGKYVFENPIAKIADKMFWWSCYPIIFILGFFLFVSLFYFGESSYIYFSIIYGILSIPFIILPIFVRFFSPLTIYYDLKDALHTES